MDNKLRSVRFLFLISLLIVTFSLIACNQVEAPSQQIEILDHNMTVQKFGTSPSSVATISGTARNISNTTIGKATITAKFYDDNGNIIDTASADIDNLSPGMLWNFNLQTSGPDAWKIVNYELTAR